MALLCRFGLTGSERSACDPEFLIISGSLSSHPSLASRALTALRPWNLSYFRSLAAADLARVAMHPERGEESVETMIRMLAGHDRNHLAQLERILAQTR